MPKIILQGYIEIPQGELEQVSAEIANHIKLTMHEEGCLVFNIDRDTDNKYRFNVYEEFVDQDAFDAHQERVKHSSWALVTKNVQRCYKIIEQDLE